MKKIVFLLILSLVFIYGCAQKAQETEAPVESQTVVTETAPAVEAPVVEQQVVETPVELQAVQETAPAVTETVTAFVKPDTKMVQTALKSAGIYTGKIDGVLGPMTKQAIKDFQLKNGLTVDGKIGPKTWALLEQYLNKAVESVAPAVNQ